MRKTPALILQMTLLPKIGVCLLLQKSDALIGCLMRSMPKNKEKRRVILSTIRSKVKIKDIMGYPVHRCPDTGDETLFSDLYKIKGLLGVGGFGVVLAVQNKETQKLNALKIWLKSTHAKMINEEANVLSQFDHPNIVKVLKFFETSNHGLMEMEFGKSGHLRKMINRKNSGKFSEEKVHKVMKNLLSAIGYVHSKDYIHRDIKPENLLFTDKHDLESLRIVDFGVSTIDPGMITKTVSDKVGTVLYMAPEQTDFTSYSKKVDIWAGGTVMYYMLTGNHPYYVKGDTEASYLKKLQSGLDLQLPEDLHVSDMGRDFFTRLCKYSPVERYTARTALEHPWIIENHNAELPLTIGDQLT